MNFFLSLDSCDASRTERERKRRNFTFFIKDGKRNGYIRKSHNIQRQERDYIFLIISIIIKNMLSMFEQKKKKAG